MNNDLLQNIDKLHSTELGVERIKKNLNLDTDDIIIWCKHKVGKADSIIREGKNWYVSFDNIIITINARSFTIITAHRKK